MIRYSLKEFKELIVDKNFNCENISAYCVQTETEVTYGEQKDINLSYCNEKNINAYDLKRDGGCIVHAKGNVSWIDIRNNDTEDFKFINIQFLKALSKYLKEKGLNCAQSGNDVFVDGYKVASGCAINLLPDYKRTFTAVQISINQDLEKIKNICLKPMVKMPKALGEYGITTEEIENL